MGYVSIAELWFPYDRRIANDRRRSQKIEHGCMFCDRLRSRSQTIAEVCFHMIADDDRTFYDQMETSLLALACLGLVSQPMFCIYDE